MRLKIEEIGVALHPNELVVAVPTRSGKEKLVVHKRSVVEDTLEIGYPIAQDANQYLVELPRETMSGAWRVWVDADKVISEPEKRRA